MKFIDNIPVWGEPLENAVAQMRNCTKTAYKVALMADHHLGMAVPIGGVLAYKDKINLHGVGSDVGCGVKGVRLNLTKSDIEKDIPKIMDEIWATLSFGIGRKNNERVDHILFDDEAWKISVAAELKELARDQLGTIGSGNHWSDLFCDEQNRIWTGTHFGSRGLGNKLATHFIKLAGGKDGINVDPVVLDVHSEMGQDYLACMNLAGHYAYAGRDWVCARVAKILGADIIEEVHNAHNLAWHEKHNGEDLWVVRKGATPAFPGQRGFIGATMGESSVIVEGIDSEESRLALYSTVHGAGRIMSRNEAAGKAKWIKGKKIRKTEGKISRDMMDEWIHGAKVELRGGGTDESPHCYKRLTDVLEAHKNTIKILHMLTPLGVCMASDETIDPYKD